jgi:Xaa-Pro aminopeptidase
MSFTTTTYTERRRRLLAQFSGEGQILLLGNGEAGMNYAGNTYPFRQDSNFRYFTGINAPDFALLIDTDSGEETLFGHEITIDHVIWMGAQPSLADTAAGAGIAKTRPYGELADALAGTAPVHYLPPYRGDRVVAMQGWLGQSAAEIEAGASEELIRAVVALRARKSAAELVEMEKAVILSAAMHTAAMRHTEPGKLEAEIAGLVEGIALAADGRLSYPAIVTVNGQILHNHYHGNTMQDGQLLLIDAGAEIPSGYAGDITRTFPVGKKFTDQQKAIYELVLKALNDCTAMLKPGVAYRDIHLEAARIIATGLTDLGLMQGDPAEAVAAGAHALFFPHGLGHMIGLDVHDMEDLGEDLVGYDTEIQRSEQFGLNHLRLGRQLEEGFVLTVEPGIYFIPALIDLWKSEGKHTDFINYAALDAYRDFGGIRLEDNIAVTADGHRVLGPGIPKTIAEVEALRKG